MSCIALITSVMPLGLVLGATLRLRPKTRGLFVKVWTTWWALLIRVALFAITRWGLKPFRM